MRSLKLATILLAALPFVLIVFPGSTESSTVTDDETAGIDQERADSRPEPPRGVFEDLVHPRAETCLKIEGTFWEEHLIININGKGEYIAEGRNFGSVDKSIQGIRTHLAEKASRFGRAPDRTSRLSVLINADRHAEFHAIMKVMGACGNESIRIARIAFACRKLDYAEDPDARSYLPNGLFNVPLPKDTGVSTDLSTAEIEMEPLQIKVVSDAKSRAGFHLEVNNRKIKEPGMMDNLYGRIRNLGKRAPGIKVYIYPEEEVMYGHIIKVINELFRANLTSITFGYRAWRGFGTVEIEEEEIEEEEIIEEVIDEDEVVDAPFDGKALNDVIGIGGGAGGAFGGKYRKRAARMGGGKAGQRAVDLGLEWLKRHQNPGGFWDCDGFARQCAEKNLCSGNGDALNDVGVTGLALLAFLGAGNTTSRGPYKDVVKKGVKYLMDCQDPEDGCLTTREGTHWIYNHAIATLALTEAYGFSRFPLLKKPAQKAVDFIHEAKNPGKAWRYGDANLGPGEQNDVCVTGWMVMCLAAAKDFGLRYHEEDLKDALAFIDEMTDRKTGRTGYMKRGSLSFRETKDQAAWPPGETEAMTAVAMLGRLFGGSTLGDMKSQLPLLESGSRLLLAKTPKWSEEKGCIDYYYWYYGSYAMYQLGGRNWDAWKTAVEDALVKNQSKNGCEKGSWDPAIDPWGNNGGRVYATALNTLCLEVVYRYDRLLRDR